MVGKKNILKDALREIKFNKKRFLLLLLIIIIGSGLYVGLKSTYQDMKNTALNYYNETNLFDLEVTQSIGFTKSDVDKLKSIDGIKGVMLTKTLDVSTSIDNNDYTIRLNSINNDTKNENEDYINRLILTNGNYPKTVNEGLVEESFLENTGLSIGDLVTLEPEDNNDLRAKKIKIVGTFKSSYYSPLDKNDEIDYYIYLTESDFTTNYYNYAFITLDDANKFNSYEQDYENYVEGFTNDVYNTINDNNDNKKELITDELNNEITQLQDNLYRLNQSDDSSLEDEKNEIKVQITRSENKLSEIQNDILKVNTRLEHQGFYEYKNETENIKAISNIIPLIFLLITVIVSIISVVKIAHEEKNEIATLKALGYGKFYILFKYVLYVFLASLIGSIIGGLLFYKIIPLVIGYVYSSLYNMPNMITNLQIKYVLFTILFSVLTITIVTTLLLIIGTRKTPFKIINNKSSKKKKNELKNNSFKKISILNKINFKNIFNSKKQIIILVIITCVLSSLFLILFSYKDSANKTIEKQFNNINKYDMKIDLFKNISSNEDNDFIEELNSISNVQKTKEVYSTNIHASKNDKNESSYLIIPKDNKNISSFVNLKDQDNNDIKIPSNGIVISSNLANKLNVKENDTITINLNDNENIKVKIIHIFKNYIDNYVYMSSDLFEKLTDNNISYNSVLLIHDDLSISGENKLVNKVLNMDNVSQVKAKTDIVTDYKQSLSSISYTSFIIIILTIILAFIIFYYISWVDINNRKKDIATLKALGFYNKEINKYFVKESLIALIIGYIIAIIFGTLISYFIITNNFIYAFKISIISYALTFVIILLISFIINIFTYFKLKKINILD